jgi:hypothetical protein
MNTQYRSVCMYVYVCARARAFVCVCLRAFVCVLLFAYVSAYMCVFACVFLCVSLRVYWVWHLLKFTFFEIIGLILGSIYINSNISHSVA